MLVLMVSNIFYEVKTIKEHKDLKKIKIDDLKID